jgi:Lrp/AsnC family transcriptional regulator, leucine-responsive regulatory protein
LEERGVITGYAATLERKQLGLANEFFVEVSLTAQTEETFEKFEKAIQRVPEILECHLMSGQFDYLLRVVAIDAEDYERIHRSRLSRLPGIQRIQSSLALRTVKQWSGYPVV